MSIYTLPVLLSALHGTLMSVWLLASARLSSGYSFPPSTVSLLFPLATTCSFQIEFNQDQIHGKSVIRVELLSASWFIVYDGSCMLVVDKPININISVRFVLHLE